MLGQLDSSTDGNVPIGARKGPSISDVSSEEPSTAEAAHSEELKPLSPASSCHGDVPSCLGIETQHSEWLLPLEILQYQPSAKDVFRGGRAIPRARQIFGGAMLQDEEATALRELRQALLAEEEERVEDDVTRPALDPDGPHALRMLQHCKFDIEDTVSMMRTLAEDSISKSLPGEVDVLEDLRHGFIYLHGRDRSCRPCLYIRFERAGPLVNDSERVQRLVSFVLEYAVRHVLVPGRVENWVVVLDLANAMSAVSSPWAVAGLVSTALKLANLLQSVHCGRMAWMRIVNAPLGWLRGLMNRAIPEEKKDKVSFPQDVAELLQDVDAHQLETCYGGDAPDVESGMGYPFRFFPMQRPHDHDQVAGAGEEAFVVEATGTEEEEVGGAAVEDAANTADATNAVHVADAADEADEEEVWEEAIEEPASEETDVAVAAIASPCSYSDCGFREAP